MDTFFYEVTWISGVFTLVIWNKYYRFFWNLGILILNECILSYFEVQIIHLTQTSVKSLIS